MNYKENYKNNNKRNCSECYLKNHRVSKEKSLAKKVSGARQGKKFLLQYTDQCKTIKHPDSELLFIAYYSEQKDRLDESHF